MQRGSILSNEGSFARAGNVNFIACHASLFNMRVLFRFVLFYALPSFVVLCLFALFLPEHMGTGHGELTVGRGVKRGSSEH